MDWEWKNPFEVGIQPVTRAEFDHLARRVETLERTVNSPVMVDQAKWYHRDELGDGGPVSAAWLP